MLNCNPCSTPIDNNQKLSEIPQTDLENSDIKNIPYQSAIGSLLYAAQGTRPVISFAISLLSRFNNNPSKIHWTAVKRVMRYLKGTKSLKLEYSRDTDVNGIYGYCDADWGNNIETRRSITVYIFLC
ncbi:hypothetical protein Trydic_g9413 [Trypoxylus dichotomus]